MPYFKQSQVTSSLKNIILRDIVVCFSSDLHESSTESSYANLKQGQEVSNGDSHLSYASLFLT